MLTVAASSRTALWVFGFVDIISTDLSLGATQELSTSADDTRKIQGVLQQAASERRVVLHKHPPTRHVNAGRKPMGLALYPALLSGINTLCGLPLSISRAISARTFLWRRKRRDRNQRRKSSQNNIRFKSQNARVCIPGPPR